MRFYKLRVAPNATKIASTFNEQFKPEKIPEHNDYQTEWIDASCPDEILIGEKVTCRITSQDSLLGFKHKL
jgi:actin-related protein 8